VGDFAMPDLKEMTTRLLKLHEGVRLKPYTDTVGKLTIGCGRNLDDRGITLEEAEYLLSNDIGAVWLALVSRVECFSRLDTVRQAALMDLAFNVGVNGLLGFRKTLVFIAGGQYPQAATEMLDSLWARQTGGRAVRIAHMIRSGMWPQELVDAR
jgi:lysozyme